MNVKDIALLVIDMQDGVVLENTPLRVKGALAIVDNVKKVLQEFRAGGLPVFHIVRIHRKDGSDVEIIRKQIFSETPFGVENTKGAEIIEELKPKENEYIVKKIRMSAFFNTDLDSILRSLAVKNIVIVGIQTPNCVRTTAFDAVAYNYNTFLIEDATAAQTKQIHEGNVLDMSNAGIKIVRDLSRQDFGQPIFDEQGFYRREAQASQ